MALGSVTVNKMETIDTCYRGRLRRMSRDRIQTNEKGASVATSIARQQFVVHAVQMIWTYNTTVLQRRKIQHNAIIGSKSTRGFHYSVTVVALVRS